MNAPAHIELLQLFLGRRDDIVERIQGLLNAQRKPVDYLQDGARLFDDVEDCFFALSGITTTQSRLRGELEEAHAASGFRPREIAGLHNGLVDPAEMMIRAFHMWQQTRWPGRNGRVHYAQTLFNLYVIRCLELMSLRLWDADAGNPGDQLAQLQGLLDQLWKTSPAEQPVLVRDARWLIQLAQSPATDELGVYFDVAQKIAETLPEEDRIEIYNAGVRMAGGHLRSQTRYYSTKKAVPPDDPSLLLITRNSNALDFALLIQELVPLLEAYENACGTGDAEKRLELADSICQGVSPDPELFVNRVDLLGAYSMIEQLFVTTDGDGQAVYTPMGQRHVQLFRGYEALIGRVSQPLHDDCLTFRPVAGAYSPYGVLYGFSTDLLEHMALKTLQPDAVRGFGLEDVFAGGGGDTLAWVSGWRKLPHLTREMEKLFDYPQQFAEEMWNRIEQALRRRASDGEANNAGHTGRLLVLSADADDLTADSEVSLIPDLPARYIGSSDRQLVAAQRAVAHNESRISSDRREGKCVLTYKTPGGSVAITKDILTEVLGAGRDVKVVVPSRVAAGVLNLMCPNLVVRPENASPS